MKDQRIFKKKKRNLGKTEKKITQLKVLVLLFSFKKNSTHGEKSPLAMKRHVTVFPRRVFSL